MTAHPDFALRKSYQELMRDRKFEEAKSLLLSRINIDCRADYCARTFTSYFSEEAIKLHIRLREYDKATSIYSQSMKLPDLKREEEFRFTLAIAKINPQLADTILPTSRTVKIQRKRVTNKGKQKFMGLAGTALFVEEIALEYYSILEKWRGIWLNPSTESEYFRCCDKILGVRKSQNLVSTIMASMGNACNRCYGAPDLVLTKGSLRKHIRWVEVKGPGDRLSAAQYVWIEKLHSANLDFELLEVLNVHESHGAPMKKLQRWHPNESG